jgi:hypothetical protein
VGAKLNNSLYCIGGMSDQEHIRLAPNDRSQPFTKDWMIVYAEDANRTGNSHGFTSGRRASEIDEIVAVVCLLH